MNFHAEISQLPNDSHYCNVRKSEFDWEPAEFVRESYE